MLTKVKMGTQAGLVSELKGWCRGEKLDEAHAVMVIIQEDVSTDAIEETMHSVKCLGRVHVRGRIFNLQHNKYHVLCECKEVVKGDMVPPEVFPIQGGGPWPVIIAEKHRCLGCHQLKLSPWKTSAHCSLQKTLQPSQPRLYCEQ